MLRSIIKKEGGFTLLELLIVIVIIGILALLIIPNITSAPKKARDTQRKTDLRAIQKGLEEYFVSNNSYPGTGGIADAVLGSSNGTGPLDNAQNGATPIMKTVPKDPKGGATQPYVYYYTPSGTPASSYKLDGCLENGSDTGTGTVAVGSLTGVTGCTTKGFELVNNN